LEYGVEGSPPDSVLFLVLIAVARSFSFLIETRNRR
jgi:hypothetical protein